MNFRIDGLLKAGSQKELDCSGTPGCELVTALVDLGDPCGGFKETGHAGIAVGNDFYDVFPGGGGNFAGLELLGDESVPVPFDKIEDAYGGPKSKRAGVVAFEFCLCSYRAFWVRGVMANLADPDNEPVQCASAVCLSLKDPVHLLPKLSSQFGGFEALMISIMSPRGLPNWILNNVESTCGASKGDKPHVRVIRRP